MKTSTKKSPKDLIVVNDDTFYVRLDAVMVPLVAMCDGLPLTFFGKGKRAYLDFDTAIAWCEREMLPHTRDKYQGIIDNLKAIREKEQLSLSASPPVDKL